MAMNMVMIMTIRFMLKLLHQIQYLLKTTNTVASMFMFAIIVAIVRKVLSTVPSTAMGVAVTVTIMTLEALVMSITTAMNRWSDMDMPIIIHMITILAMITSTINILARMKIRIITSTCIIIIITTITVMIIINKGIVMGTAMGPQETSTRCSSSSWLQRQLSGSTSFVIG